MSSEAPQLDARALLEEERTTLRAQLSELGFGDVGEGVGLDYDPNFADLSQVTAERGEAEALATKLREALTDVDAALAKLDADDGTYGRCEGCDQPIAEARLEAMPAARLCMECASKR